MCTNINVNLPTVMTFLLLYSLKTGCVVILLWTVCRSLFFLGFFLNSLITTFLPATSTSSYYVPKSLEQFFFYIFIMQQILIITQCFLCIFTIYLGIGIYYDTPYRVNQYLVCRFCTWLIELFLFVVLSITHTALTGYYLIYLMVLILEFYGFIVVYSYYVDILDEGVKFDMNEFCDDAPPSECVCEKHGKKKKKEPKKPERSICDC
ncbi:uncharacterized protein LOC124636548 [Helicoverpa zea]|uniref:uncharacterized protein LOC124636548 n=1 Tax=Helicoverpa zea TaxID=7113 RepID=UPI001F578157|nr:uncharacterized protein LOC124636548 [Helicoverpa zea]